MTATHPYMPHRRHSDHFVRVRGLNYHATTWGDASLASAERPPLLMLHGWMDVGASFQFVVDALAALEATPRWIIAPDWRGFGLTDTPAADSYWFPDYLGDLDALVDHFSPGQPIDLLGHSMGGNVVMSYAGVRPQRIRKLINLEGFGLPRSQPSQAPKRLSTWLDELKVPQELKPYRSLDAVAHRLMKNNPRLRAERAAWLAPHWAREAADGQWHVLGDPAHKRVNPVLYRVEEILEAWKLITAPVLSVEGAQTDVNKWWGTRYTLAEFHERLAVVAHAEQHVLADCGHMLHHDQPEALAALLAHFLAA
jgi:pimeloyl-ACP methyl ester carboxylesterase